MSKSSIRKQIEKLKQESVSILDSKSVPPEARFFIRSMLSMMDIIVVVLLEKKTRKNSSNSGLPPSLNNGPNGNRNKGGAPRSELGNPVSNIRNVETCETSTPVACAKCGEGLEDVKVQGLEERQKIDILYEVITHTVVSETKTCPGCGSSNKGKFPEGMDGKVQYGDTIKAMVINFLVVQMMSLQRLQEHLMGIMGRSISQAIMLKYLAQFSSSLKDWEEAKIKELLASKSIYCDETSVRVNKVNYWVHSYSSGDITLKFVHQHRGREGIEEIGIIPKYKGILVHDCWASYLSYDNAKHGLCGAHLLRELKFIEDSNHYVWATKTKEILREAAETVAARVGKKKLTKEEYKSLQSRYRNALTRGLKEMPAFPEKSGKKGRTKKTDAQNLWERLNKYEDSVLIFARVKEVDFTNNRAERDLRVSKVKQKMSGGFRTLEMAKAFYRASSYLKSMRYRGYSAMDAITLALQGKIPA